MNGNFSGVLSHAGGFRNTETTWSGYYGIENGQIHIQTSNRGGNSQVTLVTNKTFHAGPFRIIRFTINVETPSCSYRYLKILDVNKNELVKESCNKSGSIFDLDISNLNQQVFLVFQVYGCSNSTGAHSHQVYVSKIEFLT